MRENYQIPSLEEIYNNVEEQEIFTVLDMKNAFLHKYC